MLKKIISVFTVLSVFLALLAFSPVLAKNNKNTEEFTPPEIDGTYDVPGHPEMKVKVFVHKAKPVKPPAPEPSTELVCELYDFNSTSTVSAAGWYLPDGTWNYWVNTSSVPSSIKGDTNQLVQKAFNTWSDAVGSEVTFNKMGETFVVRASLDFKNIIAWGRTSASALAVTYTWYYTATHQVADVDTIMNQKYFWTWADPNSWETPEGTTCAYTNSYDAQNILTHELGHWMGLNDHYTGGYVNNTMYGYGSKVETKKDTLTDGDIAGVNLIY